MDSFKDERAEFKKQLAEKEKLVDEAKANLTKVEKQFEEAKASEQSASKLQQ